MPSPFPHLSSIPVTGASDPEAVREGKKRAVSDARAGGVGCDIFFGHPYIGGAPRGAVNVLARTTMLLGDFPKGKTIYATVQTSELKRPDVTGGERGVSCFRCGEFGHRKHECLHWKTRRCTHFDNGQCFRQACPFAHGAHEVRTPNVTNLRLSSWVARDPSCKMW